MKHEGRLIVTVDNLEYAKTVTSVSGYLSVYADASLPALTSIGGGMYVYADASLFALTSIGGRLSVRESASLRAPNAVIYGEKWTEIAESCYVMFRSESGRYMAGCRGPFTAAEALKHWNRSDERARVFTAAIKKAEGMV